MEQAVRYQRLEGAALLGFSLYFYLHADFRFLWFVVLLLSFDVFMIGYLASKRWGAHLYNLGHSLTIPLIILVFAVATDSRWLEGLSYIWIAHIGMDRLFGYGLKHTSSFKDTTLGTIGKSHKST